MSVNNMYGTRSRRTVKGVKDSRDKLFRAFKLEKHASYDPMHESVMLIR